MEEIVFKGRKIILDLQNIQDLPDDNLYMIKTKDIRKIEGYKIKKIVPSNDIEKYFIKLLYSDHEINVYKTLNDKKIAPKMIGISEFSGGWYLILEKLNPLTHQKIQEIGVSTVISCLIQKVKKMHECNVIHRDLKLSNILFDKNNDIFLCDFEDKGYTESHAAPELLKDFVFSFKTDIYALGCTTYEILTGLEPWSDLDEPLEEFVLENNFEPLLEKIKEPYYKELVRSCLYERIVF